MTCIDLQGRAREALDIATALGLAASTPERQPVHLPFTLAPWQPGDLAFATEISGLAPAFGRLYAAVSADRDFLLRELRPAAEVDGFVAGMLGCLPEVPREKPRLLLLRNDFMVVEGRPRQVEINLMAAALGPASEKVNRLHRYLYRECGGEIRILPTSPGSAQAAVLTEAWRLYGDESARVLFLQPADETNLFEQLDLAVRLAVDHGVPVARCTLEELGEEGRLAGDELWFRGRPVAVGYFRTGYAPSHYSRQAAWEARRLLEHSRAVSIPSVADQLANMKLVQHRLGRPEVLRRFLSGEEASRVEASFAVMAHPWEEVKWRGRTARALDLALECPECWVLKPQREGGRNNLYGEEMVAALRGLSRERSTAFILMEYLRPPTFRSVRLVAGGVREEECVAEYGSFGAVLFGAGEGTPRFNQELGYLVRTKHHRAREGGVVSGYSAVDSLADRRGPLEKGTGSLV